MAQVEAAEDQPLVRGVELRDPLRGLEHHGVTLDQATLVAQPATPVALPGQLLGSLRRRRELDVDLVDEGLLAGDLVLDELF